MDMHAAAIAPRQPTISATDRAHPRFAEYSRLSSGMSAMLVEAPPFANWLSQQTFQDHCDDWAKHIEYPEFMHWMRANQGGARKCPGGSFPGNFKYWLGGGRW